MRKPQGGAVRDQDIPTIVENYEVNTKALHLTLFIAQELGVMRGVYTSSMSVHYRMRERFEQEEQVPARHADRLRPEQGLRRADLPVLRPLVGHEPDRPADHRPAHARAVPGGARGPTYPEDRQAAVRDRRGGPRQRLPGRPRSVQVGHGRFDAVFIAGDEHEKDHNLSKAKRLLGWEPRSHLLLEASRRAAL